MDIYERIQEGAYKPQDQLQRLFARRPSRPDLPLSTTAAEFRAYADQLEVYEQALEQYDQARQQYVSESNALWQQFKADLETHCELVGHPRADQLYGMAYEQGHSGGHNEIAHAYIFMSQLLK